ncbi:MAG: head GIN domain-containing protein [Croceivirga sp.]
MKLVFPLKGKNSSEKMSFSFFRFFCTSKRNEGKLLLNLLFVLAIGSCNSENAPDCFQNTGKIVRNQVNVPEFNAITVFENLNLVVKQGNEQLVEIESGEFLINEITAEVKGDRLILRNENGCNLFREYGISTVYVTSPDIAEIRSSTGGLISSDGPLNYSNLSLISESFQEPEAETTDGAFDLELESEEVSIVVNGIAYFVLRGTTIGLSVNVAAGDSRIEAEQLLAQRVSFNHRGSNDIIVNPQNRISGVLRGYGNVISVNRPDEIAVEQLFNGKLIFRD